MKRLFSFLIVAVFTACTCLSQIPDQLVYVDANCEAILPDYTPDVVVIDNCDNAIVSQVPTPGITLTSTQPTTLVVITAIDISGNEASIEFNVILVDTIAPTIEAGPGLLTYNTENYGKIHHLYHQGVIAGLDSAHVNYPDMWGTDTSYRHDNLVTISNLDSQYIVGSFTDPNWVMFATDSIYAVDSLGLAYATLQIEFIEPQN